MEKFVDLAKTVIKDIRTYSLLSTNINYRERLKEAYDYIKQENVTSLEDFKNREGLKVGAFEYDEITIFDRIVDEEYRKELSNALFNINTGLEAEEANPRIGDELASWGTLGETPFRDKYIQEGYITQGLTEEEKNKYYR